MNSGSEGSENSYVIYIWILLLKFTYEFICKFTYEFICHRFFGHEHPKVHTATAQFCLTPSYKNDPKSQNVHVRWLNFALQIPTKVHPTRKIFACGGSILPSNLCKRTSKSQNFPYSFSISVVLPLKIYYQRSPPPKMLPLKLV